jgi:hypothetical protein
VCRVVALLLVLGSYAFTNVAAETTRADVRSRLDRIYARDEYRYAGESLPAKEVDNGAWAKFWRGVGEFIDGLLKAMPFLAVVPWVLLGAAVALVAWVVIRLSRRVDPSGSGHSRLGALASRASGFAAPDHERLMDEARDLLVQGRFREAIRVAMLAMWSWCNARELVRYDASLTNRELMSIVDASWEKAGVARDAVRAAEIAVYAREMTDEHETTVVLDAVTRVID